MKNFLVIVLVAGISLTAIVGGIFLGIGLIQHLNGIRANPGWTMKPVSSGTERAIDAQLQQACANGNFAGVTSFLADGAGLDSVDLHGRTPLMFAAANGHEDIVQLLLDKGAQINLATNNCTALEIACTYGRHGCAEMLIARGADCNPIASKNAAEETPLAGASQRGDIPLVTDLLNRGVDINYTNKWGTALNLAVVNEQWDTVEFLVSKGADPNITDTDTYQGFTPLVEITHTSGNPSIKLEQIHELLKVGANPNIKSKSGGTALMFVCQHDWPDMALALIKGGADVNASAYAGNETALTIAGDRGLMDMVDLLKKNGATRTDLHIIEHWKPDPPPSPAKAWALAVGAMYEQRNGTNPYILGEWGDSSYGRPMAFTFQWDLRHLNILNSQQLRGRLNYLKTTGYRTDIQKEGARLSAMSDSDFATLLGTFAADPKKQTRFQEIRKGYLKWKDRAGLGLDLCSSVNLINTGYAAHYLSDQQAWDLLLANAREAQKNFTSWNELGDNFLDSRAMSEGTRSVVLGTCVQLLSNPQDPNSPWTLCPWNTDLSK